MSNMIDYQRHEKQPAGPENTAALFVSLYVVILAFFILLTSNAQFDAEKTKNVADSVRKAFSMEVPTDTQISASSIGSELSVAQFFDEIKTSVQSVVPLEEMEVVTDGQVMIMTMDSTALFNRDDPNLRYDRRDFYRALSDTMRKWRSGMELQLSFLHGVEKAPQPGASAASTLEITRVGNFARFMENRGTAPEHLNIALEQGKPDSLTLIFDVRAFNPDRLDFGGEESTEPRREPQGPVPLSNMKGAGQ